MSTQQKLMTSWRWWICSLLFVATTVNYLDRQVLSLTYKEFIAPAFGWTDSDYGTITSVFSILYAIISLFAGKFVDWMGTKKGYLIAIGVWSVGAVMHAGCGVATDWIARGALGFIWMFFWQFMYDKPEASKHVNQAELEYIHQDDVIPGPDRESPAEEKTIPFLQCFKYKQTWSFITGKFIS